eukprot:3937810-Rhodomonas_salina.2
MQNIGIAVQCSIAALINSWMQKPCPRAYIQHMDRVITAIADREVHPILRGLAVLDVSEVKNVYYLRFFCVDPAFRSQGIGSNILSHLHSIGCYTVLHVDIGPDHNRLVS